MRRQLKISLSLILLALSAWSVYWSNFELTNKGLLDVVLTLPFIGGVTKGYLLIAALVALAINGVLIFLTLIRSKNRREGGTHTSSHGKTRVIVVDRVQIDDQLVRQLLWQMIVMDPNAPLTEEGAQYAGQKTEEEETYEATIQAAESKYETTCQHAETKYEQECASAEEAYETACAAAESLPYSEKQSQRSSAYSRRQSKKSTAYSQRQEAKSTAYGVKQQAKTTAYSHKQSEIQAAWTELEAAFYGYLRQRPQLVEFAHESIESVRRQAVSRPESLN